MRAVDIERIPAPHHLDELVEAKRCPNPGHDGPELVPLTEFGRRSDGASGYSSWCRPCATKARRLEIKMCRYAQHRGPNPVPASEFSGGPGYARCKVCDVLYQQEQEARRVAAEARRVAALADDTAAMTAVDIEIIPAPYLDEPEAVPEPAELKGRAPSIYEGVTLDDPRLSAMVTEYLPRARSAAWYWVQKLYSAELDDLLSLCNEALVRAAASWGAYCQSRGYSQWREDDPSRPDGHWEAYLAHRLRGSVLDWARRADHLSRGARKRYRLISDVRTAGARTDDEIAGASGLTVKQVRDVLAADGLRETSLNQWESSEFLESPVGYSDSLADDTEDVESSAIVSGALASFLACFSELEPEVQIVLSLRFHLELPPAEVAAAMFCDVGRVLELELAGCLAVHDALLASVAVPAV